MYEREIEELLECCAKISTFLVKVKYRILDQKESDRISETVETFLNGFNFSLGDSRRAADLQLNREKKGIDEIFTEKEIKTMPILKDLSYRFRPDRVHEFRYRRNGHERSFSSTDFQTAKKKALAFCRELSHAEETFFSNNPFFNDFANNYMLNVKRRNVVEKTFQNDFNRFENYILPAFTGKRLKEIRAPFIQHVLNNVLDDGHKRTAEAVFYLLKQIFDYAVNTDVIVKSPMKAVSIPLHERENGKALSLETEKEFVKKISGHKHELLFVTLLYTGVRPCELESISFERDGFITFRNRKQKKNAVRYKDVPITPMLAPYVERIKSALPFYIPCDLNKTFLSLVPGNRLYDLRHTFATRCQTAGVPQEVVSVWLGHKTGNITNDVYTHFPFKHMLEQAKKVDY